MKKELHGHLSADQVPEGPDMVRFDVVMVIPNRLAKTAQLCIRALFSAIANERELSREPEIICDTDAGIDKRPKVQ